MKIVFSISTGLLICIVLCCSSQIKNVDPPHSYKPSAGFVPDAATAIKVAEAVLIPVYGESNILRQRPFTATLKDTDTWQVAGSLPSGFAGGVALVEISRVDCRIIRMSHGK